MEQHIKSPHCMSCGTEMTVHKVFEQQNDAHKNEIFIVTSYVCTACDTWTTYKIPQENSHAEYVSQLPCPRCQRDLLFWEKLITNGNTDKQYNRTEYTCTYCDIWVNQEKPLE